MASAELDVVRGPLLEHRDEVATLGIREIVPFRTMLSNRDRMLAELIGWLAARGIEPSGRFFLRLYVVDMDGPMSIEVGAEVDASAVVAADSRVVAGTIPEGEYAVLAYRAKSLAANRRLHAWVSENGLVEDSHPDPAGEAFASRLEIYETDPRTERRKMRWVVELAFRTRG